MNYSILYCIVLYSTVRTPRPLFLIRCADSYHVCPLLLIFVLLPQTVSQHVHLGVMTAEHGQCSILKRILETERGGWLCTLPVTYRTSKSPWEYGMNIRRSKKKYCKKKEKKKKKYISLVKLMRLLMYITVQYSTVQYLRTYSISFQVQNVWKPVRSASLEHQSPGGGRGRTCGLLCL